MICLSASSSKAISVGLKPFSRIWRATRNPWAISGSHRQYVEWDLDEADRDGERHHISGVTTFVVDSGKTRHAKDYIFDQPVLASIWPPREKPTEAP